MDELTNTLETEIVDINTLPFTTPDDDLELVVSKDGYQARVKAGDLKTPITQELSNSPTDVPSSAAVINAIAQIGTSLLRVENIVIYTNYPYTITEGVTYFVEKGEQASVRCVYEDGTVGLELSNESVFQWTADRDAVAIRVYAPTFVQISKSTIYQDIDQLNAKVKHNTEEVEILNQKIDELPLSEDLVKVESYNLLNPSKFLVGFIDSSGDLVGNNSYYSIEIEWGANTQISSLNCFATGGVYWAQYNADGTVIPSSISSVGYDSSIPTIPKVESAKSLKISWKAEQEQAQVSYGGSIESWEPFNPIGGYLSDNSNSAKTVLHAYAEGSLDDSDTMFYGFKNGKNAIQRAIDSVSGNADIFCHGTFIANQPSDYFSEESGYYSAVFVGWEKPNITLIGEGKGVTIISGSLPDNLGDFDYDKYQTAAFYGNNTSVKKMTIVAKNMRYPVHVDVSWATYSNGYELSFTECEFIHNTNEGDALLKWTSLAPFGLGISDGMVLNTTNCDFVREDNGSAFYLHENKGFVSGFNWNIENCRGLNTKGDARGSFFIIQLLSGGVKGNITINNITSGNSLPIIRGELNNTSSVPFDEITYNPYCRIIGNPGVAIGYTGYGNTKVLRITSSSSGADSSVRFDKNSSAFGVIVGSEQSYESSDADGTIHIDGYAFNDGAESISGYAYGKIGLQSNSSTGGKVQDRLGDCSVANKQLGVIIDGVTIDIVFSKNYSSLSDEDILQDINRQLTGLGVADFFNLGLEYYPEIAGVCNLLNASAETIIKGMGVALSRGQIIKATQDNILYGVALDDIKPNCIGRVMTHGLLSTSIYERFAIKHDKGTAFTSIGDAAYIKISSVPGVFTIATKDEFDYKMSGYENYVNIK